MFLTLLSYKPVGVPPVPFVRKVIYPDTYVGKDSSYRVRELVYAASKDHTNISLVYADFLRSMRDLFSKFKVSDSEDNLRFVKCIFGNPERAVAKLTQEDNLILPIISIAQPQSQADEDKQKYNPLIVSHSIWDDRAQRAKRIVSLAPKPVNISYKVTLLSKYKSDLDQLSEQLYLLFNPSWELVNRYTTDTKAILINETPESVLQAADREDRILMKSFTIQVEAYIPMPKFVFSSTGKLERFYADTDMVGSLPITEATTVAGSDVVSGLMYNKGTPVQPDPVPDSRSAAYRIRQLIFESEKVQNDISLIHKDTLRAIRNLFSNLKIKDSVESAQNVQCIYANPERSIAKIVQEDNLILPIISVAQPTSNLVPEKQRYTPMVVTETVWDDRAQRAKRVVSLVPKPLNISYKITVLSKYKSDLDQLSEQIHLLFNPSCELITSFATTTKAVLTEEANESSVVLADREDRILMRSFTINVETYIPSPKFTFASTGKLERFHSEVVESTTNTSLGTLSGNLYNKKNPPSTEAVPDSRDAQYRIRELIQESQKSQTDISLIYKDTLQATRNLFSNLKIIDSEDKIQSVRCIYANPERSVAKMFQEDNIILPVLSVGQVESELQEDKQRYKPMISWETVWDDRSQRAKRVVSLVSKPLDITYKITILSKYKSDLDQLTEQVYLLFNPSCELQTSFANNTKAILDEETNESSVEVADREERILMRSFLIKVETYIPSPKFTFSSTGKIERFYYDLEAVKEIE